MITLENLLQELIKLTPAQRQRPLKLFNYDKNEFVHLPNLQICTHGHPPFHLTIGDAAGEQFRDFLASIQYAEDKNPRTQEGSL